MRLLIVSNMAHYRRDGCIVGHGATAREIDHLAQLFDEVVHVCCLHEEPAPASALPYTAKNVRIRTVPPAGGPRFRDKIQILRLFPHYARTIFAELKRADAVHVRCPANISLLAVVLLAVVRSPRLRWVKYAGNWNSYDGEPWSYAFQRWWLKRGHAKSQVTVNGNWPDQPDHVHAFLNPCITEEELDEARQVAEEKSLTEPIRLLFVGRLEEAKGVARAIQILSDLRRRGVEALLDVAGDGPEREAFEALSKSLGVGDTVRYYGWVPRTGLDALYARAHFILLPSYCSEGWPKVLSEAMAYGVVPLAGNVSSIPQYLRSFCTGRAIDPVDVESFVGAVLAYMSRPEIWHEQARKGVMAARYFSYSTYQRAVKRLFELQKEGATVWLGGPLWEGATNVPLHGEL